MGKTKEFTELELKLMKELTEAHKYKEMSYKLWDLLDDIDTASDMFKPCEENGINSFKKFYKYSMNRSGRRFNFLRSDGFDLFTFEEFEQRSSARSEYSIISDIPIYNNWREELH